MEWRRRSLNQRRRKQQAHGPEHVLGHAQGLFILFLFLILHESVFFSPPHISSRIIKITKSKKYGTIFNTAYNN